MAVWAASRTVKHVMTVQEKVSFKKGRMVVIRYHLVH